MRVRDSSAPILQLSQPTEELKRSACPIASMWSRKVAPQVPARAKRQGTDEFIQQEVTQAFERTQTPPCDTSLGPQRSLELCRRAWLDRAVNRLDFCSRAPRARALDCEEGEEASKTAKLSGCGWVKICALSHARAIVKIFGLSPGLDVGVGWMVHQAALVLLLVAVVVKDVFRVYQAGHNEPLFDILRAVPLLLIVGCLHGKQRIQAMSRVHVLMDEYFLNDIYQDNVNGTLVLAAGGAIWLALACVRAWAAIFAYGGLSWGAALDFTSAVFVGFYFHAFALKMILIASVLSASVDNFCAQQDGCLCHRRLAQRHWNALQGFMRVVGSETELLVCLMIGAFSLTCTASVVRYSQGMLNHLDLSSLACSLQVLGVLLSIAGVTDKCSRVPPFINTLFFKSAKSGMYSVTPSFRQEDVGGGEEKRENEVEDRHRQDLVAYVSSSEAGYYIFEVRVGTRHVINFILYAFGVALALSAQLSQSRR